MCVLWLLVPLEMNQLLLVHTYIEEYTMEALALGAT